MKYDRLSSPIFLAAFALLLPTYAYAVFSSSVAGNATATTEEPAAQIQSGNCVRSGTKAGDVITSTAGNVAKVRSITGASPLCTDPILPLQADIVFLNPLSQVFKVQIPTDYVPIQLNELQLFNGTLLVAESKTTDNQGVVIDAIVRPATLSLASLANNLEKIQISQMQDARSQNPEQLRINGMNAIRFEVAGKLKGLYEQPETYQITLIEADKQFIRVSAYAPTNLYPQQKAAMQKIATTISGVVPPRTPSTPSTQSVPVITPTPVGVNIDSKNTRSPAQRLEDLKGLLKKGLITQDDYDSKKADILKNL